MIKLNKNELMNVNGGGFSIGAGFLIGVIDGYVRPLKCN